MTIKSFEALASGETLEIRIYGPIGDGLFFSGATAAAVADAIKYNPGSKQIVVKINSPGGDAFEGMAIRSILASQEIETIAEIEGLAASAASIAAMGCKTVRMHIGSALMIHEASGMSRGPLDSAGLQKLAAALETLNDGMAAIYSKRTGKSRKAMRALMAAETWMTADQAVKDKFADAVLEGDNADALKVAASFELSKFGYQHVPQQFRAEGPGDEDDDDSGDEQDEESTEDEPEKREEVPPPAAACTHDKRLVCTNCVTVTTGTVLGTITTAGTDLHWTSGTTGTLSGQLYGGVQGTTASSSANLISPLSAAQNAEASADRKRLNTMTIKLIATAVGLSADAEESAVVAAVSQLNTFASELKALLKATSPDAVLGAIRGLQAAAEQVPTLQAAVKERDDKLEAQERAALIAADKADPEGRKLTPALETMWATQPLAAFKAFLAAAPHVLKMQTGGQQQPASQLQSGTGTSTSAPAPMLVNGKAYEQLTGQEKADLFNSDRTTFDALKRNHVERGEPRAQSQQQRASA